MNQYHLSKNGEQSGPFPESEVQSMLAAGDLAPNDLCWTEGMTDWQPINDVIQRPANMPLPLSSPRGNSNIRKSAEGPVIFCTKCGERNQENNFKCSRCGHYLHESQPKASVVTLDDSASMRMMLPVGRSGWAIASGYLGLFSVLLVFAPFALLTGILAVADIRKNSQKHGMGRAIFGIVMGTLGTIFLLILLILAASQP